MDDLVAFLRARLDEDEAAAKAATAGPWHWDDDGDSGDWGNDGPDLMSESVTWMDSGGGGPHLTTVLCGWGHDAWGVTIDDADKAHIARNHPARALREVYAKREILGEYEEAAQHPYDLPEGVREGRDDTERMRDEIVMFALEYVVAMLAAVYNDHPDYRQEWAP